MSVTSRFIATSQNNIYYYIEKPCPLQAKFIGYSKKSVLSAKRVRKLLKRPVPQGNESLKA
ncbi:hypothetical protein GCM10010913_35830 [Paenibacillus aceti]|uniref:Uncharacterized protein n=1 Tax=Paenibacillus aceti TaxID=1820010 RepID=A0ABQ1W2V3_9BACL|nr:hypothetical protein GCM10010913_35830 [Paenibacillus aceti]